jgi:hypothetical protein
VWQRQIDGRFHASLPLFRANLPTRATDMIVTVTIVNGMIAGGVAGLESE